MSGPAQIREAATRVADLHAVAAEIITRESGLPRHGVIIAVRDRIQQMRPLFIGHRNAFRPEIDLLFDLLVKIENAREQREARYVGTLCAAAGVVLPVIRENFDELMQASRVDARPSTTDHDFKPRGLHNDEDKGKAKS